MERAVSMPTISPDLLAGDAPRGDLHLRFALGSQGSYAFAATAVVEVVELGSDQLTAMPNTSPAIIGTFNLRGEIIWVLDLEYCLHGSLFLGGSTFPVIVIQDGEHQLGLAVNAIQGMTWVKAEEISEATPTSLGAALVPFVRGALGDELVILDPTAILRSQIWAKKPESLS
jgi:twitching motility protein PilI